MSNTRSSNSGGFGGGSGYGPTGTGGNTAPASNPSQVKVNNTPGGELAPRQPSGPPRNQPSSNQTYNTNPNGARPNNPGGNARAAGTGRFNWGEGPGSGGGNARSPFKGGYQWEPPPGGGNAPKSPFTPPGVSPVPPPAAPAGPGGVGMGAWKAGAFAQGLAIGYNLGDKLDRATGHLPEFAPPGYDEEFMRRHENQLKQHLDNNSTAEIQPPSFQQGGRNPVKHLATIESTWEQIHAETGRSSGLIRFSCTDELINYDARILAVNYPGPPLRGLNYTASATLILEYANGTLEEIGVILRDYDPAPAGRHNQKFLGITKAIFRPLNSPDPDTSPDQQPIYSRPTNPSSPPDPLPGTSAPTAASPTHNPPALSDLNLGIEGDPLNSNHPLKGPQPGTSSSTNPQSPTSELNPPTTQTPRNPFGADQIQPFPPYLALPSLNPLPPTYSPLYSPLNPGLGLDTGMGATPTDQLRRLNPPALQNTPDTVTPVKTVNNPTPGTPTPTKIPTSDPFSPNPQTTPSHNCEAPTDPCQAKLNDKLKGLSDRLDLIVSGVGAGLDALILGIVREINTKMGPQLAGGLSGWLKGKFEKLWESKVIDRALAILSLGASIHNAVMLSRNIGGTLLSALTNTLALIGLKDPDGTAKGIGDAINGTIENAVKAIIGAENYTNLTETWKKANRIYQAAINIYQLSTDALFGIKEGLETSAKYTGKIGNALKKSGAVLENSYEYMSEKFNFSSGKNRGIQKVIDGLQQAQEVASDLEDITSEFREAQENIQEIKEQTKVIKDELVKEEKDKKEKEEVKKTESQTPDIPPSSMVQSPPLT